jgi:cardiolipin synthase (CMP-forming)
VINHLPNLLTLLRLLLGIVFPFLPTEARFPVIIIAIITDLLDGELSRWLHAQSRTGQLLDPIADKVFLTGVLITLIREDTRLSILEYLLIAFRDIGVLLGGIVIGIRDGWSSLKKLKPRWLGKITTALQLIFFATCYLDQHDWVQILFYPTVIASGLAMIDYFVAYFAGKSSSERNSHDSLE